MEQDVISGIAPEYREEFHKFVKTGEASKEFLAYMDNSEACQRAIEQVFAEQAASFEEFARSLNLSGVREKSSRGLSVPVFRNWSWKSAYPYALAASLILAVLASFAAWNTALVARSDKNRSIALENRYSQVLLAHRASQAEATKLQAELKDVQQRITQLDSLRSKNQEYSSELARLRKRQSGLERALSYEHGHSEEAAKELAQTKSRLLLSEANSQLLETSSWVDWYESSPPGEVQLSQIFSTPSSTSVLTSLTSGEVTSAEGSFISADVELPKVKNRTVQLSHVYKLPKDVPVSVLISERGVPIEFKILNGEEVSPSLHEAVKAVVSQMTFKPGSRNGEPAKMWKTVVLNSPNTNGNKDTVQVQNLTLPKAPPG